MFLGFGLILTRLMDSGGHHRLYKNVMLSLSLLKILFALILGKMDVTKTCMLYHVTTCIVIKFRPLLAVCAITEA